MLKILRQKETMKKLLWVVTILIVISFGFFGTAYLLSDINPGSYAGKIFGKKVSFSQFQQSYQHANIQALLRYGDNFNKIKEFLNLESEAWDRLILLHEAGKRKIKVTDEEVVETVEKYAFFKRDNQFDSLLYKDIIRSIFKMRSREFEEGVRDNLKIAKLYEQVTFPISVSDEDLLREYINANESVRVDYILYPALDYKTETKITDAEVKEYYENNKNKLMEPPSIKVEYILVELPEGADQLKKDDISGKADSIYDELIGDSAMQAVAEKNGLNSQTTDYFSKEKPDTKERWSFEIVQKVFELDLNEVSEPIETPKGYYILKVISKRDSYLPEFAESLPQAKGLLMIEKSREIAAAKAVKQLEILKASFENSNADFKKLAENAGLKSEQTDSFRRGDYIGGIGVSKEFQEAAFGLNKDNPLSDTIIETEKGYYILHFAEFTPADETKFETEKTALKHQLSAKRKTEAFNTFLTRLRLKADLKDNLPKQQDQQ